MTSQRSSVGGSHRHHHRHHQRRKIWPWIVGILGVLVAGMIVCGIILVTQAREVQSRETAVITSLQGSNDLPTMVEKIQQNLPTLQEQTREASTIAHGTLWNVASHMPFVGSDIATVQGMASVLDSIMHDSAPELVSSIDTLKNANLRGTDGGLNLDPIVQVQPTVGKANDALQKQVTLYDSLKEPNIGFIAHAYNQGKTQIDALGNQINEIANAFAILPTFLGAKGNNGTYAVMAMTSSELRSSGGLIGSVGELTTDNGQIHVGDFRPNGDYLPYGASEPTQDERKTFVEESPLHFSLDIRDLAAYPDAQRTAENMRLIWSRSPWGKDVPLQGVIEVDPVFLQELIRINGNITLPDGTVLTGENTAEFLLNTVYSKYPENEQQDALFGEVAKQSIATMFNDMSMDKLMQTGRVLTQMAQERHFLIYSFNTEVERQLTTAGFTAQTPNSEEHPAVGIYLNEQNPSKLGWYLKRSTIIKTVSCNDEGDQVYHVEYSIDNTITDKEVKELPKYITGISGEIPGVGLEKVLFFAPEGGSISNIVQLNGETNAVTKSSLNGKTMYTALAQIKPGQRVTYSFDVTTSPKAQTRLTVDQTPMGQKETGVKYEGASCAVSK